VDFDFASGVARYHHHGEIGITNHRSILGDLIVWDVGNSSAARCGHKQKGGTYQQDQDERKFHSVEIKPPYGGGREVLRSMALRINGTQ
jgi:hypothetical protein